MSTPVPKNDDFSESPGTVTLHGITWPWMVTEDSLQAVKQLDVRDSDVFVTTYPKSGTHWVCELTNLILADGHEKDIDRTHEPIPFEFDFSQPGRTFLHLKRSPAPQHKVVASWQSPRVIVSHAPEEYLPSQIYQGKGKVVYVIRNPKDTFVSDWHFVRPMKLDPRFVEWDTFLQLCCSGKMMFGSWFNHVLNFWQKHRNDQNFLFLKYEDIKRDTRGAVIQLADFLGKPLTEEAIERVVELSSMKSMKARSHKLHGGKADKPPPVNLLRKGIVGDWRSVFTVAQNEAFDELFQENMAGSGLTIQF